MIWKDFEQLEQMVLEVARKQSQFFNDGTVTSIGQDKVPRLATEDLGRS